MKDAYLVITDLHFDYSKANRLDYFRESLNNIENIMGIAAKYKEKGYSVNACFLGDVFDSSFSNVMEAMQAVDIFKFFCSNFTNVYSVVGNHEITYAKNNPFWVLTANVEAESISSIKRYLKPIGICGTLVVPDVIKNGDTTIYFNHFGTTAKVPNTKGVNIGLFHQNVGSNDICKMWGTFDDIKDADYVLGYNYCFFGHMHMAKGAYWLNKTQTCKGEWLGTLGRTKITEIEDDNLQVNVPAILIDDGVFKCVEDNHFNLPPYKECVDQKKVEASKVGEEIVKEHQKVVNKVSLGKTLYETLEMSLADTPCSYVLQMASGSWYECERAYDQLLAETETVS